jgi:RnfABCDGE-type electron transport complex B subunit
MIDPLDSATANRQPRLAMLLNALLPQTQCGQCGYAGCAPYAEAVADGRAGPDACGPGGTALRRRLADLLGASVEVSLAEFLAPVPPPVRARIRAVDCIGCTKCIDVCPTDAILGAPRQLHGILTDDCTGCGLCLPPCPVDCIELETVAGAGWPVADSAAARTIDHGTPIAACTACGKCVEACPSRLVPHALAERLRRLDMDAAQAFGLARCTECRTCDEVCPVGIPLSAHFMHGKAVLDALATGADDAAHAVERQLAREHRLARGRVEPAVQLVQPPAGRDEAHAGIEAALARARARRPRPGHDLAPQAQE